MAGELTDRQVADAVAAGEEWGRIAVSTQPCDRPAAERAVRAAYRAAGLPAPAVLLWAASPLAGLLLGVLVRHYPDYLRSAPRLQALLDGQPVDRLGAQSLGQVRAQLLEMPSVRLSRRLVAGFGRLGWLDAAASRGGVQPWLRLQELLEAGAAVPFDRQVRDELHRLLRAVALDTAAVGLSDERLGDPLGQRADDATARLRGRVSSQLANRFSPWHDAVRLAQLGSGLRLVGEPPAPGLDALAAAVRAIGWWWPLPGAAVLTDRPVALHHDRERRLHRADGPALGYADGWVLHSWHGTTVPADLVDGPGWGVARILAEPNAELRRCAVERMGWDRFVGAARLRQVGPDRPDPGNPGQLLRLYELPPGLAPDRPARLLVVTNASPDRDGTRRTFGLPVPPDVPDALSAAALTFGVSRAEYAGLDRAT
jgi:hypothetical protein